MVVKVVRPGLAKVIRRDVGLLRALAGLVERFVPAARWLHPVAVVAEFEKILFDELDMLREGAAASTLRRHFEGTGLLEIPRVHWSHTRREVLVLDRIEGIAVDDVDALRAAGVDLELLAVRGAEIFFTQVFRHNFFHADLHPGNIFVSRESPCYIAVDFGIMGSLSDEDQRYLAENVFAFLRGDYRQVAELHVASGWVPAHIQGGGVRVRDPCRVRAHRPSSSEGHLVRAAPRAAVPHRAPLSRWRCSRSSCCSRRPSCTSRGLGRKLYPEFDLWATGRPFLEEWMRERVSARALAKRVRDRLPRWIHIAPELPELVHEYLRRETSHAPPEPKDQPPPPRDDGRIVARDRRVLASSSRVRCCSAGLPTPWASTLGSPPTGVGATLPSRRVRLRR